jgi:hypothetical protein
LGFTLLGLSDEDLDRVFARSPLTRFANPAITRRTRRRPRVSIGLRLGPSESYIYTQPRMSQPFEGFCTGTFLTFGCEFVRAILFTLRRVVRCRRPADALWTNPAPYRSCQDRLRCRAFATFTSGREGSSARGVLQSLRLCRSILSVAASGRPLRELVARPEFLIR